MITPEILKAFYDEMNKQAMLGKAKLGRKGALLIAGGAGLGMVGEQAKDDIVQGRAMRRNAARSQGINPLLT